MPNTHDSAAAPDAPLDAARRGFLRRSIAIVPAAAVAGAGCAERQQAPDAGAVVQPAARAADAPPYQPRYLQPAEWAFVQAAVARLIPADDSGPGAVEAGVPEFIDRQLELPWGHGALWYMQGPFVESAAEFGYQGKQPPREVYRAGIAAVDAHCKSAYGGKTFAELAPADQDAVLQNLEAGRLKFENVPAGAFFAFLLQNTKEGYLADPIHGGNKGGAAWAMIGFPGARADYLDWVNRPGERYPYPPVTLAGPQA